MAGVYDRIIGVGHSHSTALSIHIDAIVVPSHGPSGPVPARRFEVNKMEDFNRHFQNVDRARAACLKAIGDLLRALKKSLNDFCLPNPDDDLLERDKEDPMFGEIDAAISWQQ